MSAIAAKSARRLRACISPAPISRCDVSTRCRVDGWPALFHAAEARADEVAPRLREESAAELALSRGDLAGRPAGRRDPRRSLSTITCSFSATKLSGLIDFYFACNDALAYDLAICLSAWCFEPDDAFNVSKGRAMISGYERVRPLAPAEIEALPVLARGAALRFMLTRLVDWLNVPPGREGRAEKPAGISRQAALPSAGDSARPTTA